MQTPAPPHWTIDQAFQQCIADFREQQRDAAKQKGD